MGCSFSLRQGYFLTYRRNRRSPRQRMQMSNEEKTGVEEEISQVDPQTEVADAAQEVQKAEAFANKKSTDDQDRNWKEARRAKQELERKVREQEELIHRLQKPAQPQIEDDLDKLGDEDIVTKAQAKKLAARMAEEIAQKVIRQREASTVDERLSLRYPDFAEVVTEENIEQLRQTEPELAESLSHNPDPYKQAVAVYKVLKKAGVETVKAQENSKEKNKAIQNSQKPLSVNAVTKSSAIGNAHLFENGLTPELKKTLWKEMQDSVKYA